MTLNTNKKTPLQRTAHKLTSKSLHLLRRTRQFLFPAKETIPTFILGSGRSGTDILAHSISRSALTELVNEDNPVAFANWRLKSLEVIADVVRHSGARIVLFKPIVETLRARDFLESYPCSRIIFITRHYSSAINSMVNFFGDHHVEAVGSWVNSGFSRKPQIPPELRAFIKNHYHPEMSHADACALYWIAYNAAFQYLHLDQDKRAILVNYEELLREPERVLKRISAFLSIPYTRAMTGSIDPSIARSPRLLALTPEIEQRCQAVWHELKDNNNASYLCTYGIN